MTLASSHSQPRTTSSPGLRSRRAKTPKVREEESGSRQGRTTALGLHPLRANRASLPQMRESRARSRGGPMRWTKGFGMPRWA